MSEERNALAELAKFLKGEAGSGSAEFKAKVIEKLGEDAWNRHVERKRKFERAYRIIAELAKVKPVYNVYTKEPCWPTAGQACDALMACRAIAEEEEKLE